MTDAAPPPSYETRLAALESRVLALEARLGQAPTPSAAAAGSQPVDDTTAWLTDVAARAAQGDRDGAIALYREQMAADEQEAASFVDDLIAHPPGGR